jgi:hypothetical protein
MFLFIWVLLWLSIWYFVFTREVWIPDNVPYIQTNSGMYYHIWCKIRKKDYENYIEFEFYNGAESYLYNISYESFEHAFYW